MIFLITFWTLFGISIWIDIFTAFIYLFKKKPNRRIPNKGDKVSVLIPIHTEKFSEIKKTIFDIYSENYPMTKCIICGDLNSKNVEELLKPLFESYPNLIYVNAPFNSKAKKINYIVENFKDTLGEFLYVRDCNISSNDKCIVDLLSHFGNEKIAAVTSNGFVEKPNNFLGRSYHYGKEWINRIGWFRKIQQEKRNAIFVICGASTIYRVSVLIEMPIPSETKTEDTQYTWQLQLKGYKIGVARESKVYSPDVEGKKFKGLYNQIRQSYRWCSGTVQCFFIEGKNLPKNKKLLFTTILPGSIEAVMYSFALVLLPIIFFYNKYFFYGFLIGDIFLSLVATLIFIPHRFFHTLFHFPQIMFYKYVHSNIFIIALIVTIFQKISKKNTTTWTNEWESST